MDEFSPKYGEIEYISPLIRRVTAPNPAPFTFKGTGTYIVGHNSVAIIDPGPNIPSHIDALISSLKGEIISHILITHNHKDHSPAARPLSEITNTKIYGFDTTNQHYSDDQIEEGLDKNFKPDIFLYDGDNIKGKGWTIEAIHTPGHLSNHLCFSLHEEKALFTGDHVMGWSTSIISPPDGNMQDYMDSLNKLLDRDHDVYYPTHGAPIEKPKIFVEKLIKHRIEREGQIMNSINSGNHYISNIVADVYKGLSPNLYNAAARSVFAHLLRLIDLKKVDCYDIPSVLSEYHTLK